MRTPGILTKTDRIRMARQQDIRRQGTASGLPLFTTPEEDLRRAARPDEIHRELLRQGKLLTMKQWQVLEHILRAGNQTLMELAWALQREIKSIRPTIHILKRKGLLEAAGLRQCRVTWKQAQAWTFVGLGNKVRSSDAPQNQHERKEGR